MRLLMQRLAAVGVADWRAAPLLVKLVNVGSDIVIALRAQEEAVLRPPYSPRQAQAPV
ncbi:hypothetical protein D3C81_2129600 [compost metagenome]